MAERVVDRLEVVQVDQGQAWTHRLAGLDGLADPLLQQGIGQAGQVVVGGVVGQAVLEPA